MGSIFQESENFGFGNNSFTENSREKNSENIDISAKNSWEKNKKSHSEKSFLEEISVENSLKNLLGSMKPSFLVNEEKKSSIRQVVLDNHSDDPMIFLKKDDTSVLIGTGFGEYSESGQKYPTFPDIRLPFSEKSRLHAWIFLDENIDIARVLLILENLDFPPIFATKNLIAKIRNNISGAQKYDKIRFFEMFSEEFSERKIGSLEFVIAKNGNKKMLGFRSGNAIFGYEKLPIVENFASISNADFVISENLEIGQEKFAVGEILAFSNENFEKRTMKFSFDTFYIDQKSVGTIAWYVLSDRKNLAESGVVTFTIEEDVRMRAISGHIFIDSRGFVHAHEMMKIHKEIIKSVRMLYEQTIEENPVIDRGSLVQILRREIGKLCFVLTGRTPIIMPIIIEKNISNF